MTRLQAHMASMVFFLKWTWSIIKEDFYKLYDDFFEGIVDISGINRSYITLLPKIRNPETVHDYRPISLMNISPKLISKLVADRLQGEILSLIHKNQHGFIKTRSIQDCLAWGFEYIHQCQQSKRETIILKLDFEKAFDTVEHEAILLFLDHLGIPAKWLGWISSILTTGSSSVLLNGVLGKFFQCKRGVKQGDPLSPLLFVLAADFLQVLINKAASMNLLNVDGY